MDPLFRTADHPPRPRRQQEQQQQQQHQRRRYAADRPTRTVRRLACSLAALLALAAVATITITSTNVVGAPVLALSSATPPPPSVLSPCDPALVRRLARRELFKPGVLSPGEDGGSDAVIGHVFDGAPPRGPIGDGNDGGWGRKTRPRPSPPTRPPPPPEDDPPLPSIPPHQEVVRIGLPQPPTNPPPAATESPGAGTPEAGSKAAPPDASPTPEMGIFGVTDPEARVGTAPGSGGGGGGGGGNNVPNVPVVRSGGDGAARGGSASVASAAGANATPASAAAAASSSGSNGGSNSAWSSSSSSAAGSGSAPPSSGSSSSSSSWPPSSSSSSSGSTDPDGSRTDTLSPNSGTRTDGGDSLSSPSTRNTLFILAVLVPTVGFVAAASMFAIRTAQRRHTLPNTLLWWRKPPAPPARDPSPPAAAPRASLSTVSEYSPIVGYGSMHYSHIDLVPLAPPPNPRAVYGVYGGPAAVVAPPPAAVYAPRTRRVLTVERAGARVKDVGPSAGLFPQARPPEAATPTPVAPSVLLAVREDLGELERRQSAVGPPPLAVIADVVAPAGMEMGSSLRNSFRVW
ncbi:hypothetical protein AMAG_15121 [Allomyces macrogynus ATCC 38327]|uniref:Uncharacterized protein n=1 Tax=Allomyces macrogynus (strain ATCC 38327) TaxID=578462 RepID=A0A0L0T5S9_ALLM3|nr:hypothetical protein AMAG_15121 [Allomyces macrogynus ATCC 38327]|eukprot:KNE70148.1 hypothetical protein AMAG_15121 [Allomyces macrogynus ATCC 38327]